MISKTLGQGAQIILRGIVRILTFLHINPNHLTFLGFLMSIVTAWLFARGRFTAAGSMLIITGLFDMVDGMVARQIRRHRSGRSKGPRTWPKGWRKHRFEVEPGLEAW